MTTKVTISNHGPDTVVVVTAEGLGLANPAVPSPDDCTRLEIPPHEFREFYIHQTLSHMVLEKKREAPPDSGHEQCGHKETP